MSLTFKWTINKVQVAEDNLIVKVELTVIGKDGETSSSAECVRSLIRGNTFVPFNQLTEQQVLGWCFEPEVIVWDDADGNSQSGVKLLKDQAESQVADQIARQLAKKIAEPTLPWATT
jgi:ribosome-binding factor A